MKKYFLPAAVLLLAAALTAGCYRTIGQCSYSKSTRQYGEVTIISVDIISEGKREYVKVGVDGFFRRNIILTVENYEKCLVSAGYGVGSKLKGTIAPGGPCPPMYTIGDCPL